MTTTAGQDAAINAVVPAAIQGDYQALQKLIDLIHPEIVRYCRVRLGAAHYPTADDVAQEVCLAVAKALPKFEDQGLPFMAFVYRITANKIIDARRSHARDVLQPVEVLSDDQETPETPESKILILDSCNEIAELLDILNEKSREIVTLRVFGGYSAEETARILGTTAGAVRVAQFRAFAKLRAYMENDTNSR